MLQKYMSRRSIRENPVNFLADLLALESSVVDYFLVRLKLL